MASKAFRQFVWRALQAERVTSIVMICLTGLRPGLVSPKTQYGHNHRSLEPRDGHLNDCCNPEPAGRPIHTPRPIEPLAVYRINVGNKLVSCPRMARLKHSRAITVDFHLTFDGHQLALISNSPLPDDLQTPDGDRPDRHSRKHWIASPSALLRTGSAR